MSLSTADRAAVAAAVLTVGPGAPALLARIGAPLAAEATRLLALGRGARARALAREVGLVIAPVPAGLDRVHPEWIEACHARDRGGAAAGAGGAGSAERPQPPRALGQLVAMPRDAEPGALAAATRAELPALIDGLATLGIELLAPALAAAADREVAAVAIGLGAPHGERLVAEVAAARRAGIDRVTVAQAARRLGPLSGGGLRALLRAAARRLGAALAGTRGDGPRQLAQRLPRVLGLALLAARRDARDAGGGEADAAVIAAFCARAAGLR